MNAISAGPVKTASARAVKDFSTILDTIQARAPLRRNTDPAEVADTAVFLASDLGRGVTGNCLFVDAGMQIMGFCSGSIIEVRVSNMKVEVVLTEADIAQEFAEAIEARDLPEKFFFWFTRSAAEWADTRRARRNSTAGCGRPGSRSPPPPPTIAAHFGGRVPVISFGAGDGARDRLLMGALKDAGAECLYFPVDASQTMLEMACAGADDEDIETIGIKADISSPVHLIYAADAAEPPRLFICPATPWAPSTRWRRSATWRSA